ncbi:hypothetical protein Hanom_Chr01g00017801 [Helianthus anomalus]
MWVKLEMPTSLLGNVHFGLGIISNGSNKFRKIVSMGYSSFWKQNLIIMLLYSF